MFCKHCLSLCWLNIWWNSLFFPVQKFKLFICIVDEKMEVNNNSKQVAPSIFLHTSPGWFYSLISNPKQRRWALCVAAFVEDSALFTPSQEF